MITNIGWEVTSTDVGYDVRHIACGDTLKLNPITVAGLYGIVHDPIVAVYRDFVRLHNNWGCRDDLESIFGNEQDADSEPSSAD